MNVKKYRRVDSHQRIDMLIILYLSRINYTYLVAFGIKKITSKICFKSIFQIIYVQKLTKAEQFLPRGQFLVFLLLKISSTFLEEVIPRRINQNQKMIFINLI